MVRNTLNRYLLLAFSNTLINEVTLANLEFFRDHLR